MAEEFAEAELDVTTWDTRRPDRLVGIGCFCSSKEGALAKQRRKAGGSTENIRSSRRAEGGGPGLLL